MAAVHCIHGSERITRAPSTIAHTPDAAHLPGGIEQPCLTDPKDQGTLVGSYTILTLGQQGLSLARDGNIPGRLFSSLFDAPVDTTSAQPAKYPQPSIPDSCSMG
jgi:hypothetical protein